MRQINSQIESPDPLQGPFSVSGTGRRQCFFWACFQNCLRFRVYGLRASALYSNKRPLLTRIFWILPSKCHRKRFAFSYKCSPSFCINKLFSALSATVDPSKSIFGKSSHKHCPVMLGAERKYRKSSHKAREKVVSIWRVNCFASNKGQTEYGDMNFFGRIL